MRGDRDPHPMSTHGNQSVPGVSHRLIAADMSVAVTKTTTWMRKMRLERSLNMPHALLPAGASLSQACDGFAPAAYLWRYPMFSDCSCRARV
jgi:hypothetical protein